MNIQPVRLEGRHVRLEPLTIAHIPGLFAAGSDAELWRFTTLKIRSLEDMRRYMEAALADQAAGAALPFCTVERSSGEIAGSTRFGSIAVPHRRVEIGWTFLGPKWQRTALNTEAKYLMFRHAFEEWGCNRVELKTNALNVESRNAMLRLGLTEEGTFRRHMINDDGSVRDTVYYSAIAEEWPEMKTRLEAMLQR